MDDERSALPASWWAKGENYIWYSQGPYRWGSSIGQGYLADMGLPARFMHAAGGGRPFVVNKYDYRRWRVWSAEASAHGGAALAYHAGPPRPAQEAQTRIAPEDYYGPVIRYQRFMAEHELLLHPAAPWSQVALVYPRRAEREGDATCLDALKRMGEWLEDGHVLFDIVLDEQLAGRAGAYEILILPEIRRLSSAELGLLERHVAGGGSLVLTGATGLLDVDGRPHSPEPLQDWRTPPKSGQPGSRPSGGGRVLYLPDGPWEPEKISIRTLGNVEMPVYSRLDDDAFGRGFLGELGRLNGGWMLQTDAPWFVRVRAWRPERERALVLHWINYLQDEKTAVEIPIPVGPLQVACRLPAGVSAERLEWRYPEMAAPEVLEHTVEATVVRFSIPRLIVYGMSVLWLREG